MDFEYVFDELGVIVSYKTCFIQVFLKKLNVTNYYLI